MDATGLTRHRVELFHDPENAAVNIGSQQMGGPAGINIMLDATLAARCNRSVLKHDELALVIYERDGTPKSGSTQETPGAVFSRC